MPKNCDAIISANSEKSSLQNLLVIEASDVRASFAVISRSKNSTNEEVDDVENSDNDFVLANYKISASFVENSNSGTYECDEFFAQLLRLREKKPCIFAQLDAIIVAVGPGSYTGLRRACTVAKAFSLATSCQLIAVPTCFAHVSFLRSLLQKIRENVLLKLREKSDNSEDVKREEIQEIKNVGGDNALDLDIFDPSGVRFVFVDKIRRKQAYAIVLPNELFADFFVDISVGNFADILASIKQKLSDCVDLDQRSFAKLTKLRQNGKSGEGKKDGRNRIFTDHFKNNFHQNAVVFKYEDVEEIRAAMQRLQKQFFADSSPQNSSKMNTRSKSSKKSTSENSSKSNKTTKKTTQKSAPISSVDRNTSSLLQICWLSPNDEILQNLQNLQNTFDNTFENVASKQNSAFNATKAITLKVPPTGASLLARSIIEICRLTASDAKDASHVDCALNYSLKYPPQLNFSPEPIYLFKPYT